LWQVETLTKSKTMWQFNMPIWATLKP